MKVFTLQKKTNNSFISGLYIVCAELWLHDSEQRVPGT